MKERKQVKIRICLIGQAGSGKTSLLKRYNANVLKAEYKEDSDPTKGYEIYDLIVRGVKIPVWDTSGHPDYEITLGYPLQKSNVALVCCDLSQDNIKEQIQKYYDLAFFQSVDYKILVGTKADKASEKAIQYFDSISESFFDYKIKTSTKDNQNVNALFETKVFNIYNRLPEFKDKLDEKIKKLEEKGKALYGEGRIDTSEKVINLAKSLQEELDRFFNLETDYDVFKENSLSSIEKGKTALKGHKGIKGVAQIILDIVQTISVIGFFAGVAKYAITGNYSLYRLKTDRESKVSAVKEEIEQIGLELSR